VFFFLNNSEAVNLRCNYFVIATASSTYIL
jgi:hypothetical protein